VLFVMFTDLADLARRMGYSRIAQRFFRAGDRPIFAKQRPIEGERSVTPCGNVETAMEALARLIERRMRGESWKHCAIYDRDLERIWPLNEKDREAKIDQFAKKYGFGLRFYRKGMCAVFDKWPPNSK